MQPRAYYLMIVQLTVKYLFFLVFHFFLSTGANVYDHIAVCWKIVFGSASMIEELLYLLID